MVLWHLSPPTGPPLQGPRTGPLVGGAASLAPGIAAGLATPSERNFWSCYARLWLESGFGWASAGFWLDLVGVEDVGLALGLDLAFASLGFWLDLGLILAGFGWILAQCSSHSSHSSLGGPS